MLQADSVRPWKFIKPSEPHKFPTFKFRDVMDSDTAVAHWTDAIVSSHGRFTLDSSVT